MSKEETQGNIDRLLAAGFEIKTPLPQQYGDIIEGLSDDEVTILINVKARLDDASAATEPEVAHYSAYLMMPPF